MEMLAGPADCTGPMNNFGPAKTAQPPAVRISLVRCDEAAWRFLGLSLAGYDVLVSLVLRLSRCGARRARAGAAIRLDHADMRDIAWTFLSSAPASAA